MLTTESTLETKIRLAKQLGFQDDVVYWESKLEELKKEGTS